MNLALAEVAAMGLKNISIASSPIANIHEPLIEYIKDGVVTNITSSGLRDKVGAVISADIMEDLVVIRPRGGRAWAVTADDIHIDVAFLGAPSPDAYGNASGTGGRATCSSPGYAMIDAKYVDQVVIVTDTLVPCPSTPISIPQADVDYVVEIDTTGDPDGIARGAARFIKNLKKLLVAEYVTKTITHFLHYKEGFSFQTGTGSSSLAVMRFMREQILKGGIKASFALDGIANAVVELLEGGSVEKIIDVQDFDHPSAISLGENASHCEIDTNMCAPPLSKGVVINQLDTAVLSALEVDTDFNVNAITGLDSVIRSAPGRHPDTSMVCKMGLAIVPLARRRVPTIIGQVSTAVTPGTGVDVVVTRVGIVINLKRTDLIDCFRTLDVPQFVLGGLKDRACNIVGALGPIKYGDKVIVSIEYRDDSLIGAVHNA